MTKKQMIEAIVNDQIERGIIKEADKAMQIKARMNEKKGITKWRMTYEAIFTK